jgi:CHAT domain-containing protein
MLREKATETRIKYSPLDRYQILSFATHGLLAGDLGKGTEPGLILTPPQTATDEDDGFLSLSEVAQLNLNADWVILSACNTAGGSDKNAESLTGLGKAFIYAGSKSLLVSHWAVSSAGTVDLMTRLFRAYRQQGLSKAKAHQQAMLEMLRTGDMRAHPSFWAPFVILGEGG